MLVVKNLPNSPANARDARETDLIPGSGRFPWSRKWQPTLFQYSCLENSMERGTWQAIAHRVAKSQTKLSAHTQQHNATQLTSPC